MNTLKAGLKGGSVSTAKECPSWGMRRLGVSSRSGMTIGLEFSIGWEFNGDLALSLSSGGKPVGVWLAKKAESALISQFCLRVTAKHQAG